MTVPGYAEYVTNPYNLDLTVNGKTYSDDIITPDIVIQNNGEGKLAVNVKAVGSPSSGVKLSTTGKVTKNTKEIALFVEAGIKSGNMYVFSGGIYNKKTMALVASASTAQFVTVTSVDPHSEAYLRIGGKVGKGRSVTWSENDTVALTLTFNFTRLPNDSV